MLKWGAIGGCAGLVLWPWRLRFLMPALFLLVLVLDNVTKSINGYANHAQTAPLLVLLIQACFPRTRFLSLSELLQNKGAGRDPTPSHEAILWLSCLALVVPYTYIGLHRIFEGGLAIFASDTILDYVRRSSTRYSNYGFTVFLEILTLPWTAAVLKAGFVTTTLFEVASVGVLLSTRFRFAWVGVMVGFHLMTLVAMNIFFWENLVLIITALGPWPRRPPPRRPPP